MSILKPKFQLPIFCLLSSVLCLSSLYGAEVRQIKIKKVNKKIKVLVFTNASKYEDTVLREPQRIVVDFLNSSSLLPQMITSNYPPLLRIRTSQYTVEPSPITRVVLDLDYEIPYSISLTKQGVEINLGKEDTVKVKLPPPEKPAPPRQRRVEEKVSPPKEVPKPPPQPEPFSYSPRGKRDPFKPYLGAPSEKDTLLDVGSAVIVGIMWSPEKRYALAEDASGKGFILMEGDPVSGGKVLTIEKKEVIFLLRVFGGTKKVSLKVIPKKEEK